MPDAIANATRESKEADAAIAAAKARVADQGSTPAGSEEPPSGSFTASSCLAALGICNFLTPLDTQAPTALVPLLITEALGQRVAVVGRVFAALTLSSMVSMIAIMPLSSMLSPRKILLSMFVLRFTSGVAYVMAMQNNDENTLYGLYLSRVLYGLSLMTFAMPSIWISTRLPVDERPAKITAMQGALTLGIVLGPSWGAFMASFAPTDWIGYSMPGYWTLVECTVSFIVVCAWFNDNEMLPQSPETAPTTEADVEKARVSKVTLRACMFMSFMVTMGFMAGFETLMGLAVFNSYGWGPREAGLRAWVPFACASFFSMILAPGFIDSINWAKLQVVCAILVPGLTLALAIHVSDLSTPVPLWSFYLSLIAYIPNTLIFILIASIVAVRILPHEQVQANAMIQLIGQVGRGIGPVVATQWYEMGTHMFGKRGGYNYAALFNMLCETVAMLPMFCCFRDVWGTFSDPSPAQARAAREAKTGML